MQRGEYMRVTKRIKDMNDDNKPYEKCIKYGPEYLSDAELIAAIIRTGNNELHSVALAEDILNSNGECKGLLGLHHLSLNQLMKFKGIGKVKAVQLKCIGELSRRISKAGMGDKVTFKSPDRIADYFMEDMRHREKEVVIAAFLNTKHMLIKHIELSKGTVNSSLMSTRELFVEALKYNSVYVVLLHNHPSGDPTPSREDIINTRKIYEAGKLIGIDLIDHIIIGDNKYISLKEKGIMN
ncbi:MAG: JAB domain-containing protein [Lachnospiraceae bacterium]|nr:JAB domain-containing protein [Lachnospiraceae bacterium]MBQ4068981.1 DNA repair protein RadC [Lachnospiraceae bacterium]